MKAGYEQRMNVFSESSFASLAQINFEIITGTIAALHLQSLSSSIFLSLVAIVFADRRKRISYFYYGNTYQAFQLSPSVYTIAGAGWSSEIDVKPMLRPNLLGVAMVVNWISTW